MTAITAAVTVTHCVSSKITSIPSLFPPDVELRLEWTHVLLTSCFHPQKRLGHKQTAASRLARHTADRLPCAWGTSLCSGVAALHVSPSSLHQEVMPSLKGFSPPSQDEGRQSLVAASDSDPRFMNSFLDQGIRNNEAGK